MKVLIKSTCRQLPIINSLMGKFVNEDTFLKWRTEPTFLGGLDWTVLDGKEIMGKSSDRVGGGEEVAGVLEAGVPFPPARVKTNRVQQKRKLQSVNQLKCKKNKIKTNSDSTVEIYCNHKW